jgi:hypothetical protein
VAAKPAGTTTIAGALRLWNGAVSIPVTSVRAPARLLVVVSVQPRAILRAGQPVTARVQVRDTRGYVVRGAAVAIRSMPAGRLVPVLPRRSATDGRVAFPVRLRSGKPRPGTLSLRVRASDPAAAMTVAAMRGISLVVKVKH